MYAKNVKKMLKGDLLETVDIEPQIPAPQGVDQQLFNMVHSALKESPKTRSLADEQIIEIAGLAIVEGKFQDEVWLHDQIKAAEDASPHIPGSKIPKIPVNLPASIENQEDLDKVAEQHGLWMESVLHPTRPNKGGRANLKGCDLRGLNLEGMDLRGANFHLANLSGCQASGANLSTSNFSEADLSGIQLESSKLRRCNFSGANLTGANLEKADLRRIEREGTIWQDANLNEVILEEGVEIKID